MVQPERHAKAQKPKPLVLEFTSHRAKQKFIKYLSNHLWIESIRAKEGYKPDMPLSHIKDYTEQLRKQEE